MQPFVSPVLFLVFNRPETTVQVFEAIRAARPTRLYIAADGPRPERQGEADRCVEVRSIATAVDWPCEVRTLFREQNIGCRRAVSSAISWFFENEEEGIILEDDCVPHPDFFPWCAAMLERYRDEPKVMCVTGDNFQPNMIGWPHSYYYSIYNHCWGWATWRRAWALYDAELKHYTPKVAHERFRSLSRVVGFADYFVAQLDLVKAGKLNSWAFVWTWTCWMYGGLTCTPRVNLVSNIGFGQDATHTTSEGSDAANSLLAALPPPYSGPHRLSAVSRFDDNVARAHFGICRVSIIRRVLGRIKRVLVRTRSEMETKT